MPKSNTAGNAVREAGKREIRFIVVAFCLALAWLIKIWLGG